MATDAQYAWLEATARAARDAGHIWPEYAACEAAVESGWGTSSLARTAHNLFGMKQHVHPIYGTVALSTREVEHGQSVSVVAPFIVYPNDTACYKDRMETLNRLQMSFPAYAAALDAENGRDYVNAISRTYSTDPEKARTVLEIFDQWEKRRAQVSNEVSHIDT